VDYHCAAERETISLFNFLQFRGQLPVFEIISLIECPGTLNVQVLIRNVEH